MKWLSSGLKLSAKTVRQGGGQVLAKERSERMEEIEIRCPKVPWGSVSLERRCGVVHRQIVLEKTETVRKGIVANTNDVIKEKEDAHWSEIIDFTYFTNAHKSNMKSTFIRNSANTRVITADNLIQCVFGDRYYYYYRSNLMRSISGWDDYKIVLSCLFVCLFGNLLCPQISSDFDQTWYGGSELKM
jgi:hypothetical protein